MEPLSKEAQQRKLEQATEQLYWLDFIPLGNFLFFKGGNIYDLSVADLNQIECIENEGLFIVVN